MMGIYILIAASQDAAPEMLCGVRSMQKTTREAVYQAVLYVTLFLRKRENQELIFLLEDVFFNL